MIENPLLSVTGLRPGTAGPSGTSAERNVERKASRSEPRSTPSLQSLTGGLHDVRLHFRIDDESNDVTVVVVDRSTQRVIRTIPPEELSKLAEGSLIQLLT